jgi:pimeloyl-ACP methyl ester carboxylesterase
MIALMLTTLTVFPVLEAGASIAARPNIVLVHGAWADGSSWSSVIQILQKAGYTATAVQIPLTSLADDVARTRELLATQGGPTIVVGHSYGGLVIGELGTDAPNAVGLVYVAAFGLDKGESIQALTGGGTPPAWFASLHPDKKGFVSWDSAGFVKYFASDVEPARARVLAAVQKPIAGAILGTPAGTPSWRSLPSWYLVAANDQIIPSDAQRLFAKRMGATVSTVAASHLAMISQPSAVARFILVAARTVSYKK